MESLGGAELPLPIEFGQRLQGKGRCLVMGILNVTPDSFSDGGTFKAPPAELAHAGQMLAEGADLIDIAGIH